MRLDFTSGERLHNFFHSTSAKSLENLLLAIKPALSLFPECCHSEWWWGFFSMRINVKHPVAENMRMIQSIISLEFLFGLDLQGNSIPLYFTGGDISRVFNSNESCWILSRARLLSMRSSTYILEKKFVLSCPVVSFWELMTKFCQLSRKEYWAFVL